MSSGKKKHHAIISVPDIPQATEVDDDIEHAQDMVDFHCNYDCFYFDCGFDCPENCPVLKYHDVIAHNQKADEQEMLESLRCEFADQGIWNRISAQLMDTDEENHCSCYIILSTPEDQGLSENDKNVMTEIWQHPTEGIITFKIEGNDSEFDLSEFPEFWEQVYEELN